MAMVRITMLPTSDDFFEVHTRFGMLELSIEMWLH